MINASKFVMKMDEIKKILGVRLFPKQCHEILTNKELKIKIESLARDYQNLLKLNAQIESTRAEIKNNLPYAFSNREFFSVALKPTVKPLLDKLENLYKQKAELESD